MFCEQKKEHFKFKFLDVSITSTNGLYFYKISTRFADSNNFKSGFSPRGPTKLEQIPVQSICASDVPFNFCTSRL